MTNIAVGQTLNIGVAVFDFCGQQSNYIYMDNIGLGVDTPATVSPDSYIGCLDISNIGIQIKLAVASGSTACNQCLPSTLFANLGTVYTNSQGVASMAHTITSTDLSYYEQAISSGGSLKVLACITDSKGQPVTNPGICSTSIVIAGAVIPEPTHIINFQLADNPFIGSIQSNIVDISVRLVSALQFNDIPVQYIRSEMDTTNKVFKVFVKYTGQETLSPLSSIPELSPETKKLINDIQSMAIIDSIKAFAERAMVVIITIVLAVLVASIILSGGWTITTVAQAALMGGAIFMLGYIVYGYVDSAIKAEETIRVLAAKDNAGTIRDGTKSNLDDEFNNRPYSKDSCITLMTGYQAADIQYLDTLTKELSEMVLDQIKQTYTDCTNALINTFKSSPGLASDCNTARAGFTSCVNAMASATNTEFGIKYPDPTIPKPRGCEPDCKLCEPITETCLDSGGFGTLALGIVGVVLVGMMMTSKGGGTVLIKSEK